jgi:hypothetical protein
VFVVRMLKAVFDRVEQFLLAREVG